MPFTIPSAGKVAGVSTGLTTDLNNMYTAFGIINSVNVQNAAYAGGADPTDTSACDTALAAAFTALGGGSGVIHVPRGTYKITSGWTLSLGDSQQCIVACDAGVVFDYRGSGDCIRMLGAATAIFSQGSGILGNPLIIGTNATGNPVGLHFGDIYQARVDVTVQNFTGATSMGVHFDNSLKWTEAMQARIFINACTQGVVFDVSGTGTGSYTRGDLTITILQGNATYDGIVFTNGGYLTDGRLTLGGNFISSGSVLTSCVIRIGSASATASFIRNSQVHVGVECTAGAHTPQTIIFGAGSGQNQILNCYGQLEFAANAPFAGSNNGAGLQQFVGHVAGDSQMANHVGFIGPLILRNISGYGDFSSATVPATAGTITPNVGTWALVAPAGNITGVILSTAGIQLDGQIAVIVNGSAFTITFAASGTSHVADGVLDVIPANTSRAFIFSAVNSLWYRVA